MTTLNKLNDYGIDFQIKLITLLLTDKKFLINTIDGVQKEFFENEGHQWIVGTIKEYYNKYHIGPTKDYIESKFNKLGETVSAESIKITLQKCYKKTSEIMSDREWVESEFKEFVLNQTLRQVILDSVDLLQIGDYAKIQSKLNSAFRLQYDKHIGIDFKRDIESVFRDEERNAIPFKSPALNALTQGGYGAGDLVLLFGSPGGGKTSLMIAQLAYALSLGKNVIHYTLELSEGYTAKKYYSAITGIEVDQLKVSRKEVQEMLDKLPGRLIIKEYPPKRASFATIENHLQQLLIHEEFKPDAIAIDYLDYVKASTNRAEKKDEIDDVYIQAKSLAKELGIPILSPSQANRTAAKTAIIEGDAAAGSYDKLMIADIVISLARTRNDKNAGIGRLHFMKNRYGKDGDTFLCEIDLARNLIVIGEEPMTEEQIEMSDRVPKKQARKVLETVEKLFS